MVLFFLGYESLSKGDNVLNEFMFQSHLRVSMGWWHLRLSAKIWALLRLSVNFFQLRLTIKLKINLFVSKRCIYIRRS